MSFVLAIDQGTTSSRAIVFRGDISIAAKAQAEFPQHFPASGWVEHEPEDIWTSTVTVCRDAIAQAGIGAKDIAAIGITNQRETTVVWDRATGQAVHRAIVWQDRRTADICAKLKADGREPVISQKTGLIIDPYFSGTKVAWILDHVPGARARAARGELMFGTVDCYLLWRLTGGKVHATDATNASRTLLFNIHTGQWDDELLEIIGVPRSMLPEVKDSSARFGESTPDLFGGAIAICGIAGDQQAATIGQACFRPGMMKSTYGTGCFALLNTGTTPVASKNKLLTTIAYQLGGASAPMRSKARSSSQVRQCSGCATASASSSMPPRPDLSPISRTPCRASISSRPSSAWARRTGIRACAAPCSASPATPARPSLPTPPWKASATRPLISGPQCAPTGRARRWQASCSASMAA
ncbi:glycerol kinase [Bradyrhizobium sp. GM0.4]